MDIADFKFNLPGDQWKKFEKALKTFGMKKKKKTKIGCCILPSIQKNTPCCDAQPTLKIISYNPETKAVADENGNYIGQGELIDGMLRVTRK